MPTDTDSPVTESKPVDERGLVVKPLLAAYLNLFHDVDMGTVPDSVKPLVEIAGDHLRFLPEAHADDPEGSPLPKDYFSLLSAQRALKDLHVDYLYASDFDGYVYVVNPDGQWRVRRHYDHRPILVVLTGTERASIKKDVDAVEAFFRDALDDVLPDGFRIRGFIRDVKGTAVR